MTGRQFRNLLDVGSGERVWRKDQAACWLARDLCDGSLNVSRRLKRDRLRLDHEPRRCGFGRTREWWGKRRRGGIEQDCRVPDRWRHLLKKLHPFCAERRFQVGKPGDIAAGMRQAQHDALGHRFAHADEDNRKRLGRRLGGLGSRGCDRENNIRRQFKQFCDGGPCAFGIADRPAIVDRECAAELLSELRQRLLEGLAARLGFREVLRLWHHRGDSAQALRTLRIRRHRPHRRRSSDQTQKFPPPHRPSPKPRTTPYHIEREPLCITANNAARLPEWARDRLEGRMNLSQCGN
jgi:hypothetical protein